MDEILLKLCRHNVSIMDGWHPFPATCISRELGISIGKVRYHLKKLKEKGLVESVCEGGMTEDGEVYCLHGWHITDKAKETSEYKEAARKERDICMKCFGWDCGIKVGEQDSENNTEFVLPDDSWDEVTEQLKEGGAEC